jgi:glycosyltransferase involved in cell wall biosynthesis
MDSILAQEFRDFEFIVVDDGSTDETGSILDAYTRRDPRLRVQHRPHQGIAATLNAGVALARGRYIARADADDVYLSGRLGKQLDLLERQTDVGVCGAWARRISPRGWRLPGAAARLVHDDAIRCELVFRSAVPHPVAMLRRDLLVRDRVVYDPAYEYAEDYELWTRLSTRTRFANVPEVLFLYRLHRRQTSQSRSGAQVEASARVHARLLRETLQFEPTPAELMFHERLCYLDLPRTTDALVHAQQWLAQLVARNQRVQAYPLPAFLRTLDEYWLRVCIKCAAPGVGAWSTFWRSRFAPDFTPPAGQLRALALRASGVWPPPGLRRLRATLRRFGGQLQSPAG